MGRRASALILFSIFLSAGFTVADDENPTTGSIGFAAGFKNLDTGWEPLGDQFAGMVLLNIGQQDWPVQVSLAYINGEDEEVRVFGFPLLPPFCCFTTEVEASSKTTEWDVGVRRTFRQDRNIRPHIGGGIAFISGKIRVAAEGISESDSTTGFWIGTGFRRSIHSMRIEWGIDLHYSDGTINLGEGEIDAGGGHALLYFGTRW